LKVLRALADFSQGLGVSNPGLESMNRFYCRRGMFEGACKVFPVIHAGFELRGLCES
jgi:hypothetical protein